MKNLRKIGFLITFLSFCLKFNAQFNTDSLKLVLKNAKHDTVRCNILNLMIESEPNDRVWVSYNDQLLKLAEKNILICKTPFEKKKYQKHLSVAFNNLSFLAEEHGENEKEIEYLQKSLKLSQDINDKEGIAASLNHMAIIYEHQGNVVKALEYFNKSINIREAIKDKKGLATSYANVAGLYENQGDIPKGLEYYHKALKIQEEIQDKQGIALTLNGIGYICVNQDEILKALEVYQRALVLYTEINDDSGIAFTLNNMGFAYKNLNDFPKALYHFNKSLKLCEKLDYQEGIASCLNAIGTIYLNEGDYNNTLKYYEKALKIFEEINNSYGINNSLKDVGIILLKLGKTKEALSYAKRSLITAKEIGYPENIKNAAALLKSIYRKQNKFKEAFEMYELEIQMRDSVNNEETKKASVKKQFQYEYEKKAAADSVKHAEEQKVKNATLAAQNAQLKQEKTQRFALYGGLILVIAFSCFVFNRFRITQKQKKIIQDQKVLVDISYSQLHEKNKEVIDSITYARRIQRALITSEMYIDKTLNRLVKK